MIVKWIELKNFRNYKFIHLDFDSQTNIFYGDNGQGKTNLLEAVYFGGTSKSYKGSKDREMIRFGKNECHMILQVEKNSVQYRIDLHIKNNRPKGIAINGIPIRKASELYGTVYMIFFSPEDLNMIKDGPSVRRKFINQELGMLDKVYLNQLIQYNRVVSQRNMLLKEIFFHPEMEDTLSVWDEQLIRYGGELIRARYDFIEKLNEMASPIHHKLTDGKENLAIYYEPSAEAEQLAERLKESRQRDLKFKMTCVGPHRDDLNLVIDGVDIRRFGSQGQQRTAALSLKLAEIQMAKEATHDTPVLLLDDVLSELDSHRQNCLLGSIHDIQTLITCTGLDEFVQNRFHIDKVFYVKSGQIEEKNSVEMRK